MLLAATVAALLLSSPVAEPGTGAALSGRVVVLVVDRVSPADFPSEATPFCAGLASEWSLGLMASRTPVPGRGAEYATLGMGFQARGAAASVLSYNSDELFEAGGRLVPAGELYRESSGLAAPPRGVVNLGWRRLADANSGDGGEPVDTVGERLKDARVRSGVLGNSDAYGRPVRAAPLICVDAEGAVALGDVAGRGVPAPDAPGGVVTDYRALEVRAMEMLEQVDLLVVDTGDTARIDGERAASEEDVIAAHLEAALARFDRFAAAVAAELDLEKSLLLIVSPAPPSESCAEGVFLTPLIAAGGDFRSGSLTSASTRRKGVVSNTDFAPTVLSFYGLEAPGRATGSVMESARPPEDPSDLQGLAAQVPVTMRARWPVVIVGGSIAIALSLLSLACWLAGRGTLGWPRDTARLARVIQPAALVLLAAPLACVAVSAFTYDGYAFPSLFCAALSLFAGLGAWGLSRLRSGPDPVVVIGSLTVALIVADQLAGGRLMLFPLLGSGALEGMRFYGLTNIMVGVLVSMATWAAAGFLHRARGGLERRRPGAAGVATFGALAAVALVTGLGGLGANLGGFVTASVTFLVFTLLLSKKGLTAFRGLVVIPVTVVVGVGAVVAADALFFQTHASRSVDGGPGGLIPILGRKLAIHAGQIGYLLVPSLLLIAGVLAAVLWMRRPGSGWEPRWKSDPEQTAALYSLLVGGLTGLVFNDTGITLLTAMALSSALVLSAYGARRAFRADAGRGGEAAARGARADHGEAADAPATPAC